MKAEIIKKADFEELPPVSSMEIIDGMIYILGYTTSPLYCLDPYLNVKKIIELPFPEGGSRQEENASSRKQIMTHFTINGYSHLLIFSTASNDHPDIGFLVKLPTPYNRKHLVWKIDLNELYNLLRANDEITENGILSIQGLATADDFMIIIASNDHNQLKALYFFKDEFIEFVQGHTENVPFPLVKNMGLKIDAKTIFKACIVDKNKLFFLTSRKEEDRVDNMIGMMETGRFETIRGSLQETLLTDPTITLIEKDEIPFDREVVTIAISDHPENEVYTFAGVSFINEKSEILLIDVTI